MISSEVKRTLVKSLPELWAELSDPSALARHLGELGEIRITRTVPEKSVEWEAGDTTGKVLIKPSGWGTKVTLSVSREIDPPAPVEIEDVPEPVLEPAAILAEEPHEPPPAILAAEPPEPQPAILVAEPPEPQPMALAAEPPEPKLESEPELESELEPRRGFFARLFRRRRKAEIVEPTPEPRTEGIDPSSEPEAWGEDEIYEEHVTLQEELLSAHDEPVADVSDDISADIPEIHDEQPPDVSAELKAAEEVAAEQVTAVLTGVLDRLGAAHHRPFSRA